MVHGRGRKEVVAQHDTEMGKIADAISAEEGQTPLRQSHCRHTPTILVVVISLLVFATGFAKHGAEDAEAF